MSTWLPDRNSGSYQAVIDYVKFLLGRTSSQAAYPPGPDPNELSLLPNISPELILADLIVFTLEIPPPSPSEYSIKLLPRQKPSWLPLRRLFLLDLARLTIPRATLAWQSPDSPWNRIMLAVLQKHWRWAMAQGAFSLYTINPKYCDDVISRAVMERWLRGRMDESEGLHTRKRKNQRRSAVSLLINHPSTIY